MPALACNESYDLVLKRVFKHSSAKRTFLKRFSYLG
jgi:hypothetical protein